MLRLRLLGTLVVERDGASVALPATAARVLAYLALRPGPHERDAVAVRFWPDTPVAGGRASLRSVVWALRKSLGDDAVVASRSLVGLAPDRVWVDLHEVEERAQRGDMTGAVALCTGDLMPGITDDWAREARTAHHDRHATLLEQLAHLAESDDDMATAVRWSRLRCALDPFDEPAHRALMDRLDAAGDRAGGLVVGREFVERLRVELGLRPGAATRAALARLHTPAAFERQRDARQPGRRQPMFGRSAELATLMRAWAAARDGHGRVVLVTGEGGIGKTRLITEVARRTERDGARVAVGAGVDVGGEAPLAVWQELARALVSTVPVPPETASWPAELGRLSPDLTTALGHRGVPVPVAAPELERLRVFDAMLRLVEWAASAAPVLLVAEDVHRADRASLALCTHIGRRLATLPVLFLLTRRDRPVRSDADALLTDLAGRGVDVGELELDPLADGELAAVTRSVADLADEQVREVVSAADGNPLLAVERARALAAGSTALPATLRAAVRAAIGPLAPSARDLADGLAVAGRGLSAMEIDAMALTDRAAAELAVLETGLMRRDASGLRFRHALLAEAARADLSDPLRHHHRVALAVEAAAGPTGDRVAAESARHLQQAGRDDLAGPRWRRAAQHARSLGALPEAAAFWTEASRCTPDDPEPLLQLAEVWGWLGRREDFEQTWNTAAALVPDGERSAAWCRRGHVLSAVLCHPSAALSAYQQALDLLPRDAPTTMRAEVTIRLAHVATAAADTTHAESLLAEIAVLEFEPSAGSAVDLAATQLQLLVRLGRFDELEDAADAVAKAIEHMNRPDQWWAGLLTAAAGLAASGRVEAALRVADRALALTREVPVLALPCLAARAHLLARLGRHEQALAAAHDQLVMAQRLDSPAFAALASNDSGLVALSAGRFVEAAQLLGSALDGGARISRPASRLARAEALARAGDPAEATAELRRAVLEPVGIGDQPWALVPRMARIQGLIALARGETVEAARRLTEAVAGWGRLRRPNAGDELMASLVDLGRPPVVGLVEPEWELARLNLELAQIEGGMPLCQGLP